MQARAGERGIRGQFVRFLLVGALNTAFGYAVFALLVLAGLPSMPALVATYVAGVLFNFATTRRLVFRRAAGAATFARFVAAYVVIYFFNAGLLKALESAGAHPLAGQALCIPVVAVFSFFLFKLHVFK
jgi:putative flippase GtrA